MIEELPNRKELYVNKRQGVIKLFINGVQMSKQRFMNAKQRKKIMKDWTKAFEPISWVATIYMQILHYEVIRTPREAPVGRPRKELPEPERAPTEYSNIRLYDQLKEPV